MAFSLNNANVDKDVMASLAARLMGKPSSVAAPKAPSTAAPRSMPSPQPKTSSAVNAASTSNNNTNNVSNTSNGTENVPTKQTPSKIFLKENDDTKVTSVNSGPSLFGSADQLAEARQFASCATQGNPKRPESRFGRSRLATAVTANTGSQLFSGMPMLNQPPDPRAEGRSAATGLAPPHGHPPVNLTPAVAPTPAPTPIGSPAQRTDSVMKSRTNESNIMSSPTKTTDKSADSMTKAFSKTEFTHAHPSSPAPAKKDDAKSLQARQLTDITNTFRERPAAPPHFRSSVSTAVTQEKKTERSTVTQQEKPHETNGDRKKVDAPTTSSPKKAAVPVEATDDKMVTSEPSWSKTEVKPNDLHKDQVSKGAVQNNLFSQTKPIMGPFGEEARAQAAQSPKIKIEPGNDSPKQNAIPNGTEKTSQNGDEHTDNKEVLSRLMKVHDALATVNTRIEKLEADSFETQKQLVSLVEEKERRGFLGTHGAKEPFGLEVRTPNGKTYNVQAHAELKVYELIRRIRMKADIAPLVSQNPRVVVNGKVVGHGMMLGEVGIVNERNCKVKFIYG